MAEEVICIVGPTAAGKTELAVALAQKLGGEIISADSRQIYRHLNAGTAKPSLDSAHCASGIAYHLIDIVDPAEPFDAGKFAHLAHELSGQIRGRGRIPILAGGTGLYFRAYLKGLAPLPQRDEAIRCRLEAEAEEKGRPSLHQRLALVDPQAAQQIPANNIQRVIRALEVYELTGQPISSFWDNPHPLAVHIRQGVRENIVISIEWPPEALRARLTLRCQTMWPNILNEVRNLVPKCYTGKESGFQSLGYTEALSAISGEISNDEGLQKFTRNTLAYAKRQRTWFRHQVAATPIQGGRVDFMLEQVLRFWDTLPNSKEFGNVSQRTNVSQK